MFALTCTGMGGSASQAVTVNVVPPPTVTLAATPSTVDAGGTVTLVWSTTNALACTASGEWSGDRPTSGTEDFGPVIAPMTFTLTCSGIGGTTAPRSVQVGVNAPPAGHAIVSGTIAFERVPFDPVLGRGLDPDNPVPSPVRGVIVEALPSQTGTPIAVTTTNALGQYAFVLPHNTTVFLRAKAQLLRTGSGPTWNFRVLDNRTGALWALDRQVEIGTADLTNTNLTAATGWRGSDYVKEMRAAAPFAILDTVYTAMQLVRSAAASVSFPPLNLYWSPDNRPAEPICPSKGNIGTTFYASGGDVPGACETVPVGIYVLGDFNAGDTDEFDQHVIAHEFAHYLETEFSRSDSIGGQHGDGDKLDLRVAFGEGWGNAFAGMVVNDPVYRDSFSRMASDFSFNVEEDDRRTEGWFSEASVAEIIWDLFDPANETTDEIELGFGPIFAALTNGQRTTTALTSIFSFLDALWDEVPNHASAIIRLRNGEQISGTDEFGTGESNDGGDPSTLPVYRPLALNSGQQSVCVRAPSGPDIANKLGYSKFFKLDLVSNALLTIRVVGVVDPGTSGSVAAKDPDFYVYRRGELVVVGDGTGPTETREHEQFPAGTYIIEVLDYELRSGDPPHCMTVSVTGT